MDRIGSSPARPRLDQLGSTAIGVWTVTPENDLLLLEVVRGRFGVDRIVPELLAVCRRWNPGWIALEANGFRSPSSMPPAASPAWPPFARSATKAKENWSAPPRRSSWPTYVGEGTKLNFFRSAFPANCSCPDQLIMQMIKWETM